MDLNVPSSKPERLQMLQWLQTEWQTYSDPKFDSQRHAHDKKMRDEGVEDDSWWFSQVFQYVRRGQILGIDTPAGRQQMIKCLAALTGLIESMIRVYGAVPEPGHTSGEVVPWGDWP